MACAEQNILIVELRHTTGMLFDEKRENIKVLDELAIIEDIADEVRKDYPYF